MTVGGGVSDVERHTLRTLGSGPPGFRGQQFICPEFRVAWIVAAMLPTGVGGSITPPTLV